MPIKPCDSMSQQHQWRLDNVALSHGNAKTKGMCLYNTMAEWTTWLYLTATTVPSNHGGSILKQRQRWLNDVVLFNIRTSTPAPSKHSGSISNQHQSPVNIMALSHRNTSTKRTTWFSPTTTSSCEQSILCQLVCLYVCPCVLVIFIVTLW